MRCLRVFLTAAVVSLALCVQAQQVRVKDLTRLEGVRANQLVGYGLVVGLEGSGDSKQTVFTVQSMVSMLSRLGIDVPTEQVKVKNVAAVMVTAELPQFARNGDAIDVQVSSLGDARSLQGGTLLQTPLRAADQQVYAVAQGAISIGGFGAAGKTASVTRNHQTVGRIPNGALVEREVEMRMTNGATLSLVLKHPDFTTASRIASAVQEACGVRAVADDAGRVKVDIPVSDQSAPTAFIARVQEVNLEAPSVNRVVINERTGTIVIGGTVRLSPVAIAHGGITVTVADRQMVSQPGPLSDGKTTKTTDTELTVSEETATTSLLGGESSVEDLVRALNAIRATPRDIIAILQAIKQAGGLQAELVIL